MTKKAHKNSEGETSLPIRPRFPVAAMHWFNQYSDPDAARIGTIQYVQSLTPGLTEEQAATFVDKLLQEAKTKESQE